MDLQVAGLEEIEDRVDAALARIGELRAGTRVSSDALFSRAFMRDHTQFDSFAAFCARSPWSLDDPGEIRTVPQGRLDEYVAERTDFGSWEEMKTRAAEEEIIDQIVS